MAAARGARLALGIKLVDGLHLIPQVLRYDGSMLAMFRIRVGPTHMANIERIRQDQPYGSIPPNARCIVVARRCNALLHEGASDSRTPPSVVRSALKYPLDHRRRNRIRLKHTIRAAAIAKGGLDEIREPAPLHAIALSLHHAPRPGAVLGLRKHTRERLQDHTAIVYLR